MINADYQSLNSIQRVLLFEALEASRNAYNPYSGFYVGAALWSEKITVSGSNVENAAYGSTICAERAAILRANAMGYRCFDKLAVIGRGSTFNCEEVVSPCGSCRQMLFELTQISGRDIEVIMSNTMMDKVVIASINELLPLAFGPRDLGINIGNFATS